MLALLAGVVALGVLGADEAAGRSVAVPARDLTAASLGPKRAAQHRLPLSYDSGSFRHASQGGTRTSTTIPLDASQPIRLATRGGEVLLTPLDVAPAAAAGVAVDDRSSVLYRGTAPATDTLVTPQPGGGVETFSRLRSSKAPRRFSWAVTIDGALRLVPTDDGGVNIVNVAPLPRRSASSAELPVARSQGVPRSVAPARPRDMAGRTTSAPSERDALPPCDAGRRRPHARGVVASDLFTPREERETPRSGLLDTPAPTCQPTAEIPWSSAPAPRPDATRFAATASKVPRGLLGAGRSARQTVVASVNPPTSKDAAGDSVPTRLSVEGNVLTMEVDHRAGQHAYPILADPLIGGGGYTAPCSNIVQAATDGDGRPMLALNCHAWFAIGFNDYRLMNYAAPVPFTFPQGCGSILNYEDQEYELQRIADSGSNVVRVWFFQKYYQDYLENHPRGSGWTPFEQLLTAARAKGLMVVPAIVNHWNQCDRKDGSAFNGEHASYRFYGGSSPGYLNAGTYGYRYSAKQWAQMVASHFSPNNPGVGDLWRSIAYFQIANEAEADLTADDTQRCAPNAAEILYDFGQDMATAIKSAYVGGSSVATPLVSLGTMAIGQCGVSSAVEDPLGRPSESDFAYIHSAPAIDLCEVHDYDAQSKSDLTFDWYGIPYNSLAQRIAECGSKPMVIGEAGLEANVQAGAIMRTHHGPGPHPAVTETTLRRRAQYLSNKMAGAFNASISGYLTWDKIMAGSDSSWNAENDEKLGYGAYGFRSGGVKHQDHALCVMKTIAHDWTLGTAPPDAPSTAACDAQIPVPGPANHYAFVDGTTETWAKNAGGWGNLGTAFSNARNHGGSDGTGSLRITVGGAPLDTSVTQVTIGGHTYNPYSEIEVETDAVGLLSPGDEVTMWIYNPSTNACRSVIEAKPVLRVNAGWHALMPRGRTITANQWTQLSTTVPSSYSDWSGSHDVTSVRAVGIEIDVPGSGMDCFGATVHLDDVTW